jgi:hypothetical protein
MSLDIDRINGLLTIVKEAAGHPTKLRSLGALAMRKLEGRDADAKKEHDELLKKDAADAAKAKADADAKAKRIVEEDAKKNELTSRPQVKAVVPKVAPVAEESEAEPVKRREVPEEVTNG